MIYPHQQNPSQFYINAMMVAKHFRGKGIAQAMIQQIIKEMRHLNVTHGFLHVHQENIPAIRLYEKIGFQRIET